MPKTDLPLLSDTDLLARLIAFDSTSHHSNLPIAEFICDYLDRPGIRIEHNPSPDGDKVNLIVTVGPETGAERSGLTLSGHMDVVPALEPDWQSDPFVMTDLEDRLVGRGTCDMKGFVALAINAAATTAARAQTKTLRAPLSLILTYDEEVGTLGARHFVETWDAKDRLPRRAIIGEPTSLQVVRMHKGHAKTRLRVGGRSAHSGYPHLGANAIETMGRAIAALVGLRQTLEGESSLNSPYFPEVPFIALNLARIGGGSAINIVPDTCWLDIGFRVLPGLDTDDAYQRIHQLLADTLKGEDWDLTPVDHSPPMLLTDDNDLYRKLCTLRDQNDTVSASYATDAGWFQHGDFDCLLYGPGDIANAHRPNEFLPKTEFAECAADLARLVRDYCG